MGGPSTRVCSAFEIEVSHFECFIAFFIRKFVMDLLKVGSLEKTVTYSFSMPLWFEPWHHFFCGKSNVICCSRERQVMQFFVKKKRPKFLHMMPN